MSNDSYQNQYDHEPSADNAFGREDLARTENPALRAHLAAGHSLIAFPRSEPRHDLNTVLDGIFGGALNDWQKGGIK